MDRKVLGRGLEALIPQGVETSQEKVRTLKTSDVYASRFQPRLRFSEEKIKELASSIREKGVIQPILVRETGENRFELIAGERRLRAVKHLGLTEIPAIVRRVADADLLEMSIIENIQREELNAVEEAKAYRRLAQEFGHSQDHIANRVGKDKSSISNLLRLLNLPEEIQELVTQNTISFGHAKVLLSLPDAKQQMTVCQRIIDKGLSVRQAEQITGGARRSRGRSAKRNDPGAEIRAIEEKLQHALGTKVRIQHGSKRGKIEIEYYSLDDLERVLRLLRVQ
jgi:ParB family transcriptional regulator, chromosome partitioning protein